MPRKLYRPTCHRFSIFITKNAFRCGNFFAVCNCRVFYSFCFGLSRTLSLKYHTPLIAATSIPFCIFVDIGNRKCLEHCFSAAGPRTGTGLHLQYFSAGSPHKFQHHTIYLQLCFLLLSSRLRTLNAFFVSQQASSRSMQNSRHLRIWVAKTLNLGLRLHNCIDVMTFCFSFIQLFSRTFWL